MTDNAKIYGIDFIGADVAVSECRAAGWSTSSVCECVRACVCVTRPDTFPGHLWVCYVIAAVLNENTVHVRDRQHCLSHTGGLRVVEIRINVDSTKDHSCSCFTLCL